MQGSVLKNAPGSECAHLPPWDVHRSVVRAQASTQSGAWACERRFPSSGCHAGPSVQVSGQEGKWMCSVREVGGLSAEMGCVCVCVCMSHDGGCRCKGMYLGIYTCSFLKPWLTHIISEKQGFSYSLKQESIRGQV